MIRTCKSRHKVTSGSENYTFRTFYERARVILQPYGFARATIDVARGLVRPKSRAKFTQLKERERSETDGGELALLHSAPSAICL